MKSKTINQYPRVIRITKSEYQKVAGDSKPLQSKQQQEKEKEEKEEKLQQLQKMEAKKRENKK